MIDFSVGKVAAAYASNAGSAAMRMAPVGQPAHVAAPADAVVPPEGSFGAFVDDQVARAIDTVQRSEHVSLAALAGHASAQEVVHSVIAAEMTIQTVVAIRDKMVQAYQEIMRMPI